MRAKDVMTLQVLTVKADAPILDVAELLVSSGTNAIPVVDDGGRIVGIVSEADVIYRAESKTEVPKSWFQRLLQTDTVDGKGYVLSDTLRVADVMTRDVVIASERWSLAEIAALMQKHRIKCIPIVRATDGAVIGTVNRTNVLQGLLSPLPSSPDLAVSPAADEEKRIAVILKLDEKNWSSSLHNNVVVRDGVVHLWGYANNDAVRKACEVAAGTVPGVTRVENHMVTMLPQVSVDVIEGVVELRP
jgi:CBS domain-containing protein